MKRKGLSLLEVLVAATIMILIITSLANIFLASKGHVLRARNRIAGGELGYYFLDPLQKEVRQDTWSESDNCLATGNCPNQTAGIAEGLKANYTANYTVTPDFTGANLSKVKVNITWTNE